MRFLCVLGLLIGLVYGVYHWFWAQKIITLIMVPIVALELYAFYRLTYRGYSVNYAYLVGCAQIAATSTFTLFMGLPATYWLFTSAVANFLIMPARSALLFNLIAMLAVSWFIMDAPDFLVRFISSYLLTNFFFYAFSRQLNARTRDVNELLFRDPLTLVGNRLAMDEAISMAFYKHERHGTEVSLLMLDLDFFKSVNDAHGHAAGDRVLLEFAQLIKNRLRTSDQLFRFGGEEFVILTENTDQANATALAEDIRELVSAMNFVDTGSITVSIGVAQLRLEESVDGWLKRADDALYQAKARGRDTVCSAS
ncbi:MAG: GGDEF domain-containing protein [Pseudomonadales bacterium]|nr:GGDEF domain-containing protein [Pseudomonadales bacterium]